MLQLRERGRFVAAGFPQELLEPQLEGLSDGGDHVLCEPPAALQDVTAAAARAVLGHVCDVVERVRVTTASEADVWHLVLVNDSAGVEVTQLEAEGGDGELDVGARPGQRDPVAQHAGDLEVRSTSSVVVCSPLTHPADALLGYR